MKRVIAGRVYNTETATRICSLPCHAESTSDFSYHDTDLYRTKNGNYFLAGEGGPMSMWSKSHGNSTSGGEGITPIDKAEAMEYAESADLKPEEMIAAGFNLTEA